MSRGRTSEASEHADILDDLPRELWLELAKTFRRAIEDVEDAELPPTVRPYRGWKPDRLFGRRPRRAIAEALSAEAWLRERLVDELGADDARASAAEADAARLVAVEGEARAAVLLVGMGRWGDLASLGADVAERRAARHRAAAEQRTDTRADHDDRARARLERDIARLRKEQDRLRRALEGAEASTRAARSERDAAAAEARALEAEVARLTEVLRTERASHRDRLERVRRRAEEAEARARVDEARIVRSADELEQLAAGLRRAVEGEPDRDGATDPGAGRERAGSSAVPRTVAAAHSGRPCSLPLGLSHSEPDGLRSLLAVEGMLVLLDGYNVTKDPRGLADASLEDQRRWLTRVAAGVAARFRVRLVVVFDSGEGSSAGPGSRGVVVEFATDAESADDRLVEIVAGLDHAQPVTVVTSDRELAERCRAHGADVVPAGVFLRISGG